MAGVAGFFTGMLLFGTFWGFWLMAVVAIVILFVFVEKESWFGATLTMLVVLLLLQWFGNIKAFSYIGQHPLSALGWVAAYLAAGILWSMIKWYWYLRLRRECYLESKAVFLESHSIQGETIPENLLNEFRGEFGRFDNIIPKARENKGRILTWMAYWPWSMLWTMIHDWVERIFRFIFDHLVKIYQSMADYVFRDIVADLPKKDSK
jgi:hypothetical protein